MITEDEYNEAKRIIEEYENQKPLDLSKYLKFNINHYVWVKLNSWGYAKWQESFTDLPDKQRPSVLQLQNRANVQGYISFQLWDLMSIFGPHIDIGRLPVFDGGFLLHKSDLKECEPQH